MIVLYIYTLLIAFIHALEELEIEGKTKHGWARNLPTVRFYNKFTELLVGKELTMYHIFLMLRLFLLYHLIFIFHPWTIKLEAIILSNITFYLLFEDFMWFICNPKFRFTQFKQKYISWHKRWFWGLPYTYWWGLIIGISLLICGGVK